VVTQLYIFGGALEMAKGRIGRNAVEPTEECTVASKRGESAVGANEHILNNVLYVGGMAQITRDVPCDAPLVLDDQRFEGFRIARLRKPHQFRILIGDHHGGASIRKRAIRR